jgi:hypothetical protein
MILEYLQPQASRQSQARKASKREGFEVEGSWDLERIKMKHQRALGSALLAMRRASAMYARGERRSALDVIFRAVDQALKENRLRDLSELYEAADWGALEIDLAVTALMASKPAALRLPARTHAVQRFLQCVRDDDPARAERLQHTL